MEKDIEEYISNMPESIINGLISKIEEPINRAGLFVRVFGRVKTVSSLQNKLKTKDYNSDHKIQDLFGVRITAYFKDDVKICKDIMQRIFEVDNISEDLEIATKFEPERLNIVCKIPIDIKKSWVMVYLIVSSTILLKYKFELFFQKVGMKLNMICIINVKTSGAMKHMI